MQPVNQVADRMESISVSSTARIAFAASRLRAEGVDVVDLGPGEPDFPTPDHVKQAAIRAIERNFTKYTDTGGIPELKQAVCDRHAADFGTSYTSRECIVSVGAKHVIFNLMQALINPGDEVVIPVPYWVTFRDAARFAGAVCVFVPTAADDFSLTADAIEAHLTPRTRMVVVNSPSNPTGAIVPVAEFEKILRLTASRGIYLLTDECYCHFVYEGTPFSVASLAGAKDTVLVVGSVSKTYAMTGWRIGYGLAPQPVAHAMLKIQSHTTSNPNSVAQAAALEALCGPQDSVKVMLAEYRRRRDYVVERVRAIPGVECAVPPGAFYVYPDISALLGRIGTGTPAEFAEALLERERVSVMPGEAFGTDRHIRISYATSMHELERGLDRIERFIQEGGSR